MKKITNLTYRPPRNLRINRGWRRRKEKTQLGFYINPISGVWSKQETPAEDAGGEAADEALLDKVPNQPNCSVLLRTIEMS